MRIIKKITDKVIGIIGACIVIYIVLKLISKEGII